MPEKEDNNKLENKEPENKKPDDGKPQWLISPDDALSSVQHLADRWPGLSPARINYALATIMAACFSGAKYLWGLSSWRWAGALVIGGAIAAIILFWRLRRKRPAPPEPSKPSKHLLSRRQVLFAIPIALGVGASVVWWYWKPIKAWLEAWCFRRALKNAGLPPELYDLQSQLESLAIDQSSAPGPQLANLNWLHSGELKNLTLACPNLDSLDGLTHLNNLQSLDIDLNGVPLKSLNALNRVSGLRNLILRNIGSAKKPPILEVGASFPELTDIDLDLSRLQISAVPALKACSQLKNVTLDLRTTTKISELPDLSNLGNLQTVSLWLDTSRIASIKPVLTNIAGVQTLKMSLDGTQLDLLSELNGLILGPEILDIFLTSRPNSPFPNLSGMNRLNNLSIHMPGARGDKLPNDTPVPDITHLKHLESLSIFLNGSDVPKLPPIGNLTGLLQLSLDLKSTKIKKLPDFSRLKFLGQLTLNVSNSEITELPRLRAFSNLVELHLLLEQIKGRHSLKDIESLSHLEILELDISGSTIDDLTSIVKVKKLKTLILRLRWEQVKDLPGLAPLENLCKLELRLNGSWTKQELPALGGLQKLQKLILDIKGSQQIKRLPDLSPLSNLSHVTLHLDNSAIEDLSALENVGTLKELVLNVAGTHIQTLPNLPHLEKVRADIKHSDFALKELRKLSKLQEIAIAGNLKSLEQLPVTLKQLVFDAGAGRIHVKPTEDIINC